MAELPTVATATTTPEVARALAGIEAAKLLADKDVTECLDAIGDLVRITGAPNAIFAWVRHIFGRENLRQYAAQQHLKLHESRASEEEQLDRTVIIWTVDGEGLAIVPAGQDPATTLLQLREEIAQRAEEKQRAGDFQASVQAGHVEAVDTWHARTTQAQQ
ncbi:hypothetical protein [Streptomyces sp. NPDC008137]|uniref:hypothetical protein n=1 Tax=Streptomyces sp. NPDC008137 TaxID=3364813 RepID=UPI0036EF2366